ncbi:MAG: acyloxyacyl hydrolase [Burkholderiales bacterium]
MVGSAALAETCLAVFAGQGEGVDMARTALRFETGLAEKHWVWPAYLQVGVDFWWVPQFTGQRTDLVALSLTPIYRYVRPRNQSTDWYFEAGAGAYLLSDTVGNYRTTLPSAFQFGSHIGAGLAFGQHRQYEVGIALQHLSNARIKQPNRGIDFVQMFFSWRLAD